METGTSFSPVFEDISDLLRQSGFPYFDDDNDGPPVGGGMASGTLLPSLSPPPYVPSTSHGSLLGRAASTGSSALTSLATSAYTGPASTVRYESGHIPVSAVVAPHSFSIESCVVHAGGGAAAMGHDWSSSPLLFSAATASAASGGGAGVVGASSSTSATLKKASPTSTTDRETGLLRKPTAAVTELFDAEYKFIYEVPTALVVHLPPARLNITRLVVCRNYRPHDVNSCGMGDGCKFVHVDCDLSTLECHPIHVNYIWRHEELCTYPRLPAGEVLEVLLPDGTLTMVPSERVLITLGARSREEAAEPLQGCKRYETRGICNCGDRCVYVHRVVVDATVKGDYKRAAKRREVSSSSNSGGPGASGRTGATTSAHYLVSSVTATPVSPELSNSHSNQGGGAAAITTVVHPNQPQMQPQMQPRGGRYAEVDAGNMRVGGAPVVVQRLMYPAASGPSSSSAPAGGSGMAAMGVGCVMAPNPLSAGGHMDLSGMGNPGIGGEAAWYVRDSGRHISGSPVHGSSAVPPHRLQQMPAVPYSVTIAGREQALPTLDDPNSMGILLFLPRGSSEATVVGSVPFPAEVGVPVAARPTHAAAGAAAAASPPTLQ